MEVFPKNNKERKKIKIKKKNQQLTFALRDSSTIFIEKKIYLIIKLHMYICTEYITHKYMKQEILKGINLSVA